MLTLAIQKQFDQLNLKHHKYLLAFSGGPDSVYLLWLLSEYYKDELKEHIALCYINYHDSSFVQEEESIVYDYVKRFALKLYKDDTKFDKEKDKNFEEWARLYRYQLFSKIVRQENFEALLTAHQKTDHVETYLLQKKRNNLPLYYGLKTENELFSIKIIRPLLSISKKELTKQLIDANIPFYDDITNRDPKKARTLIRSHLEEDEIDSYAKEIEDKNNKLLLLYNLFSKHENGMDYQLYCSLDENEQKRYCFFLIDKLSIPCHREGYGKRIFDFLKKRTVGEFPLANHYVLYRTKDFFFLSLNKKRICYQYTYTKPGYYENEYFAIDLTDSKKFNFDHFPITIRNYHEGDTLSTNLPTKDVKKALRKQSVPFYLLSCYPVFLQEDKIICVPFYKDIKQQKVPLLLKFED